VAVVGAGLGGLALGVALHRLGVDCLVFEKAPELRSISQGNKHAYAGATDKFTHLRVLLVLDDRSILPQSIIIIII
jgi:2-polyprenyl-6-methoxyphenol hydroxylase-like FAD-dependent oxidoreductase